MKYTITKCTVERIYLLTRQCSPCSTMVCRFSCRYRMSTALGVIRAAMSKLSKDEDIESLMIETDIGDRLAIKT